MRRFILDRGVDTTGVSGTGIVAQGVLFDDGVAAVQWLSDFPTSVVFHQRGMDSIEAVHGHHGDTQIVFLDPPDTPHVVKVPREVFDEIKVLDVDELCRTWILEHTEEAVRTATSHPDDVVNGLVNSWGSRGTLMTVLGPMENHQRIDLLLGLLRDCGGEPPVGVLMIPEEMEPQPIVASDPAFGDPPLPNVVTLPQEELDHIRPAVAIRLAEAEREAREAQEMAYRLSEALRLTQEYVGPATLPPVEGWSWYDGLEAYYAAHPHLRPVPDEPRPIAPADQVPTAPPVEANQNPDPASEAARAADTAPNQ